MSRGRVVLEAADDVVELLQRSILDGQRAAAPGEADRYFEAEQVGEVALERRGGGLLRRRRFVPRGLARCGEQRGLAHVEAAADDLARHPGGVGGVEQGARMAGAQRAAVEELLDRLRASEEAHPCGGGGA